MSVSENQIDNLVSLLDGYAEKHRKALKSVKKYKY